MFEIRFVDRQCQVQHITESLRDAGRGEITIGGFKEIFYSPLELWSCNDYEIQWREGYSRIIQGSRTSYFVTGVHPTAIADFVEVFMAWRVAQEYRFQQSVLPFSDDFLNKKLNYDIIGEYSWYTEDGDRIEDDWKIRTCDL